MQKLGSCQLHLRDYADVSFSKNGYLASKIGYTIFLAGK